MEFYARFAVGEHWPALPPAEVDAYRELVLREDNGRAYLQLMRNLDRTRKTATSYAAVVDTRRVPDPVQVIWAADDRTLPLHRHGWKAREASGLPTIQTLPGKRYFQEDMAPEIAAAVARFVG